MISRLRGKVLKKTEDKIYLATENFTYEVFIPRTVSLRLNNIEEEFTELELVIYHYFQVEQSRHYPVLIGFLSELEREFFERFIKVSGIGPKAALKAIDRSISRIAQAIDEADLDYLKNLPGIGLQRAKNIVALLQGKMGKFSLIKDEEIKKEEEKKEYKELIEEAYQVLRQLQYKSKEAKEMIQNALKRRPDIQSLEELLTQIYQEKKLKG